MPYRPPTKKPGPVNAPWIFIGTPAHDNRWHSKFGTSLITLFDAVLTLPKEQRFGITTSTVAGGGVAKARNNIAWEFLTKTKASHLIFVDSDIGFLPGDIMRLINHDLPIVGGLYTHKRADLQWSARAIPGEELDPETGFQRVAAIGTGFLCVKREVFEKMIEQYPEIAYVEDWEDGRGNTRHDFFSVGVVKDPELNIEQPTYLTEDWYFCYRCRKMGYDVMADTGLLVSHWEGMTKFPLDGTVPTVPVNAPEPVVEK
jgi:hypothetical protein